MTDNSSGAAGLSGFRTSRALAVWWTLLAALIALALVAYPRRHQTVDFSLQAQATGRLQLFQDQRGQFNEGASRWYEVGPTAQELQLRDVGREVQQLRFDPPKGVDVRLCGPRIAGASEHQTVQAHDLAVEPDGDCVWLRPRAGAQDPHWSMAFAGGAQQRLRQTRTWQRLFLLGAGGALLLLAWGAWVARASLRRWLAGGPGGASGTSTGRRTVAWALVAALLGLALFANARRHLVVDFTVQAQSPGTLQVYQHERGLFNERSAQRFKVGTAPRTLRLPTQGRDARHLRFDPPADVNVRLCGPHVEGAAGREAMQAHDLSVQPDGECLWLRPHIGATDPWWSMSMAGAAEQRLRQARTWHRLFLLAAGALVLLLAWMAWTARASVQRRMEGLGATLGLQWIEARLHWALAVAMLVFGAGYAITSPPGSVADEEAHLGKIIRVAHGSAFGNSPEEKLPNPRDIYGPFKDYLTNKGPFKRAALEQQLDKPLQCERVTTGVARHADGYFPHQYVLPALAFRGACAMDATNGTFLHLARLLNLLLATALVTFGVAKAQRGKWGLVAIALLPMSMYQMSSLSADSLFISLSLAWTGLISGVAGGSVDPRRARWALGVLAFSVAFLKPGAAWILAGLLVCRPAYKAAGASFPRALLLLLVLPWLVHIGWTLTTTGNATPLEGVNARANLHFMLAHPLAFPSALMGALTGDSFQLLMYRTIGVLGWLDVYLAPWAYYVGPLAIGLAAFCGRPTTLPTSWMANVFVVLLAVGSVVMIALPFYLYWTHLGAPVIQGIQGRYFLPTLGWLLAWCAWRSPVVLRGVLATALVAALVAINLEALRALDAAYFVVGR